MTRAPRRSSSAYAGSDDDRGARAAPVAPGSAGPPRGPGGPGALRAAPDLGSLPDPHHLTDTLPALFAFVDVYRRIRFASAAFEAWFGLPTEQIRGQTLRALLGADAYDAVREHVDAALGGSPRQYQATLHRHGVGPRVVHVLHGPYVRPDGTVAGFCALMIDVTDRHQDEQLRADAADLLAQVARGRSLPEVLNALVGMIERQTVEMLGSILLLDEDGRRLRAGAAPSLPEDYVRAVDGLEIGPDVGSCGTAAYTGTRVIVEDTLEDPRWRNFRPLAERYGLRASWSEPIRSSAGIVLGTFAMYYREPRRPDAREQQLIEMAAHLAGIAIERWKASEEIEARVVERTAALAKANETLMLQQAELANAARLSSMVVMAASLSHELSQPLQAIVNYARSCDMQLRSDRADRELILEDLRDIVAQANRAAEIIRQLRTVVREEPARRVPTDVNDVVRDAVDSLLPRARQRRVRIETQLAPDLPELTARPLEIQQVLISVAQNGIEAMDGASGERRLKIATRAASGGAVEVLVRDRGPGVPPDHAEAIFDAFFTTKASGMGLGLSLARRLVERQDGRITVEAAPEGGALFRILLRPPRGDEDEATP